MQAPNVSPNPPAARRRPAPAARTPAKAESSSKDTLTYVVGACAALVAVGGLYFVVTELTKPTKKKRKKSTVQPSLSKSGTSAMAQAATAARPPGEYYDSKIDRADGKPINIAVCCGEGGKPGAFVAAAKVNVEAKLAIGSQLFEIDGQRVESLSFKDAQKRLGKLTKGKLTFKKNADLSSKWTRAEGVKNEGNALFSKNKLDESIDKYKEAVSLHPTNKVYYSNKVLALLQKAKKTPDSDARKQIFNQALADCRTMRELDVFETYQKGHYVRGVVLFEMGHFEMARTAFQTVLRIAPGNKKADERLNDCIAALAEKAKQAGEEKAAGGPDNAEDQEVCSKICREIVDKAIKQAVNDSVIAGTPPKGNGEH